MNAASILAAWTAFETLSPQTYKRPEDLADGDVKRIVSLSGSELPWFRAEDVSRSGGDLYYQVFLGAIKMELATKELIKAFGSNEELDRRSHDKAAIAAILLDRNGVPLKENGIVVSSFAWALPVVLKQRISELGQWPDIEGTIIEKLAESFRQDDDGKLLPLKLDGIMEAYELLVRELGLPEHLIEPPKFGYWVIPKAREQPEVSLLNSFYLRDLSKASSLAKSKSMPMGLRRYLGMDSPKNSIDLLNDREALKAAVTPHMMPAVRWPAKGSHPLVLLQQAAVNLTRSELAGTEGIIAINGPPGTGKTTLLRDLVAACILDRAAAMVNFVVPDQAFTDSGAKFGFGDKCASVKLHLLDKSLKGHEILVASSNNKAVENISKEMPAASEVGRTTEELRYFKSISDQLLTGCVAKETNKQSDGSAVSPIDTWGLCAAALGNSQNKKMFKESFWWHPEYAFRVYLKAAKGDDVVQTFTNPETGQIERRAPHVVFAEKPPTPQTAVANWNKARERFALLKSEIDKEFEALEMFRRSFQQLSFEQQQLKELKDKEQQLVDRRTKIGGDRARYRADVVRMNNDYEACLTKVRLNRKKRPGTIESALRTKRWVEWLTADVHFAAAVAEAEGMLYQAQSTLANLITSSNSLTSEIDRMQESITTLQTKILQLENKLDRQREALGDRVVDEEFFRRGHVSSNLAAPWISDSLHRKREELFIAALDVHKAFIDASAQKILHNLTALMEIFGGGSLDEGNRKLLGDLWSTLFLVVPVISSTFASVDRMLGGLKLGDIGWLLIDEAGQALPQAAVGAVMRAKRTVVVGDPLQIPPVTTIPERLISEICRYFNIDQAGWSAPIASAQTLADRASKFQASFRTDSGARRVGVPLLVHRRCQEPMFGMSNRIAYDGQMVHAPTPRAPGQIGTVLGASTWFDCYQNNQPKEKWCPAEGEQVIKLLKQLALAGIAEPDLFIISPFKQVVDGMKLCLKQERDSFSALGVDIHAWVQNRIGTIHTVQGQEAEAVFLVLGAQGLANFGARSWAASAPNILNVAVSRAKQNIYVIGSYADWSTIGHARELASVRQFGGPLPVPLGVSV